MMKKLAILLTLLLVVMSFMLAGCGRVYTASNPLPLARTVPHSVGAPFQNCNVCHIADQLAALVPHKDFDKDTTAGNCLQKGACHGGLPVVPPPATSSTVPAQTATQTTPTATSTSSATATATATSTATKTGAGTGAGTGTGGGGAPVLTKAALALEAPTHPAAYAALCMMCHAPGMGVNQFPLPPTWPGTPKTPGTFTITPGSDQDHTGRTDTADCVKAGCHAKSW